MDTWVPINSENHAEAIQPHKEGRTYSRIYVGMDHRGKGTMFRSLWKPTSADQVSPAGILPHGTTYVVGPFRTVAGAQVCGDGTHSPNVQTVAQFERLARGRKFHVSIDGDKLKDCLPHGSGIDGDWTIEVSEDGLSAECYNSFHRMNENGYYCGWIDFRAIIRIVTKWEDVRDLRTDRTIIPPNKLTGKPGAYFKGYALDLAKLTGQFGRYQDLAEYLGESIGHALESYIVDFKQAKQAKEGSIQTALELEARADTLLRNPVGISKDRAEDHYQEAIEEAS